MTSSMPEARMFLNELSPITQRRASTRFDLPQPFGPTTPVSPGSILNSALSQKLLKPVRRKRSNFIVATLRLGAGFAARGFVTLARRESFFARPRHGLAAISESRNQPRRAKNLCGTARSPYAWSAQVSPSERAAFGGRAAANARLSVRLGI